MATYTLIECTDYHHLIERTQKEKKFTNIDLCKTLVNLERLSHNDENVYSDFRTVLEVHGVGDDGIHIDVGPVETVQEYHFLYYGIDVGQVSPFCPFYFNEVFCKFNINY